MEEKAMRKYFAASNSAEGFVNYFPRIFNRENCDRIYVIKGGPGTGKSRFMNEVAAAAEKNGMDVAYYYCSSDADSLDGIIIGGLGIGFVDGTAPHAYEPTLVGAFEQIINLGDFWDANKLAERRGEIFELSGKKSEAYRRAYSLLAAYGNILRTAESLVAPVVDFKKLASAVKRLLHKLPQGSGTSPKIAIRRSVGMNGLIGFDSIDREAETVYAVNDYHGTAHFVMKALLEEATARKMSVCLSYDPIMRDRPDGILLRDCGIAFVCGVPAERVINAKRFVKDEDFRLVRDALKGIESTARDIMSHVLAAFIEVKKYHFELEGIYSSAMDFESKEDYTREFIKKLFLLE